ncbi:HAMP domain-containing histidine kinase [Staphylococcus massiliensis]|uniref:HAMP domain-containing sensor histidine kinase n=1 Tax=Staphylococcus massiliensis TaxID=555791 RepID=UPI001EDD61F9|nr:ATP-binding protein [Staphylococcus massiliensis]MCG3401141.1 HAMP domain-containing histidine kinase [Staphylococcus massiliensis]
MKQRTLKTKWTLITTTLTFLIIFIFCLMIIYFLSDVLKQKELETIDRSSDNIINLMENKPIDEITFLDLNASLGNFQKVILYDSNRKELVESTNDDSITYSPKLSQLSNKKISIQHHNGNDYLVVKSDIDNSNFTGSSVIIHSMENYNSVIQSIYYLAIVFGLITLAITALISYIFSIQITKPIVTLSNKMIQIRRNGFQEQLRIPTNYEETDDMIDTFNKMMEQLEDSFKQQQQFVEDASHELRTPLQIIQGHLNLIKRWGKKDPEVLEESLNISIEEMTRITRLVEELLLLTKDNAKMNENEIEVVDVNHEIKSRIKSLEQLHPDYTFLFDTSHEKISLTMNRFHLEQVLLIFIDNAIKYDQKEKRINIQTTLKNKRVMIEITDHGFGIPKKDLEFIYDRFYRVDKSRSRKQGGNGLGLSIAQKVIKQYEGHIKVDSEVGKFTTFTITF